MNNRYAMLTVDTEALPNRAEKEHVRRLILGIHGEHRAGVREMANIAGEFGAAMIFFLDLCGALSFREELGDVARWLDSHGQDVQLHTHPEYLPESFWREHNLPPRPGFLNEYEPDRADFIITYFSSMLESFTGKRPRAFRAGSFRWNKGTLRALKKNGIRYSFNNSMCAVYFKQCSFSLPQNEPYRWNNGIVEIPVTEHQIFPKIQPAWWARLQYPQSKFFRYRHGLGRILPGSVPGDLQLMVFLLHSWSFLHRDEKGYEVYRDDQYMEGYRALVRRLSRECDIITTGDLDYLIDSGKIRLTHTETMEKAKILIPDFVKRKMAANKKAARAKGKSS